MCIYINTHTHVYIKEKYVRFVCKLCIFKYNINYIQVFTYKYIQLRKNIYIYVQYMSFIALAYCSFVGFDCLHGPHL